MEAFRRLHLDEIGRSHVRAYKAEIQGKGHQTKPYIAYLRRSSAQPSRAVISTGFRISNPPYGHDGPLDEVHVSPVARSAAWIRAEHANQSAPKTFARIGAEENR